MVIKLSSRVVFSLIALFCIALLAGAYQLQYGPQQQQPCPLCILQRYAYMGIALVAAIGAIHGPQRLAGMIYNAVIDTIAISGAVCAGWQMTKGHTMQSCVADPVGQFVNNLPTANLWPEYLFATGGCADVHPPILGLNLATWSFICFSLLALFSMGLLVRASRKNNIPS